MGSCGLENCFPHNFSRKVIVQQEKVNGQLQQRHLEFAAVLTTILADIKS